MESNWHTVKKLDVDVLEKNVTDGQLEDTSSAPEPCLFLYIKVFA